MELNQVVCGDAFDVLDDMDDESIHAVVTDPPYGLAFMGKSWDDFEPSEYQLWCENWARRALRVLKPGGHMLAFSGNRTHHRLFCGVEDAGFEVRDTITWHYGSGFPKGTDMSKHIDRRRGTYDDREVTGTREQNDIRGDSYNDAEGETMVYEDSDAAHPDARKWEGWKTQLKPATEYVVVARKPFDGAAVDCVLEHGTGALNIDGCRVEAYESWDEEQNFEGGTPSYVNGESGAGLNNSGRSSSHDSGRYPANVVFDETAAADLDEQVGDTGEGTYPAQASAATGHTYGEYGDVEREESVNTDSGGPPRYFYTSKASRAERTLDGRISNAHPTVKPGDLMRWLVRLVTREGQTVLDPFAGSGTTLKAAKDLRREFIGIERQPQWADVARVRCGLTPEDAANVRPDENQTGVADFR